MQTEKKSVEIDVVRDYVGRDVIAYTEEYMQDLKIVNYETIIPLYFSSIGAHILNLLNRGCARLGGSYCPYYLGKSCGRAGIESLKPNFLQKFGQIPDLRLHIMHLAPSGFSKDMFMDFFMDPNYGFFKRPDGKDILPHMKLVRTTEAGYVGSLEEPTKEDRKEGVKDYKMVEGIAKKNCAGIIGIPEFYSISVEGKMDYSAQIENSLLEILEKGEVNKIMAKGVIHYFSYHTLWAGTQPGMRFDVSSGIGRRLNFYVYMPTQKDEEAYLDAQKKGYGMRMDMERINNIRLYLSSLWNVNFVSNVEFSDEYVHYRDAVPIIRHTDLSLIDNLALGYNFMTSFGEDGSTDLRVSIDDRLKVLIDKVAHSRKLVSMENKIEWELFYDYMKEGPVYFYDIVHKVSEKQIMDMKQCTDKLNEGIRQGIFGSFAVYDRKQNLRKVIVFNPDLYRDGRDAMKEWLKDNPGDYSEDSFKKKI